MRDITTNVCFDMRAPKWATPSDELYSAALQMAAFADEIGVDFIGLMEHHGSEDGYLPQPFTLAGGMAAVTKNARILLCAVILPLHDPITIAEQIAVADLMSNGRINVVFGAGYVPFEFAMFGKSLKDRAKLMDLGIDIILRALKGEKFEFDGRPVHVRPLPVQEPENILLVGGGVAAAAKRAARFDIGFLPMNGELVDVYLDECRTRNQLPRQYFRTGLPICIHLCEDPDIGWAAIEKQAVHVMTEYAKWAAQEGDASTSPFSGLIDPQILRQSGLFAVWTPDDLLERLPALPDRGGFTFQPLLGGLSPAEGWKSLQLLKDTMPRLKKAREDAAG
ncbi:LLM class flavin-dependent oxidoreductase [Mycobacterium decipiens]|uniref:Oxidoreductase n=1 Tax=Mycobacterium decipiens TaxID=1430326 RepID=A0A1X2LQL4_9MYCO|nr:LLM class flavin-dependent oxidoreductase [Mycobacterium decipiens]OSC38750.1 oxidoreductase [Mycobacterium decipiens]